MTFIISQCEHFITSRNDGIKITHVVIMRFLQGQHVLLIVAKFGTSEETKNPLCHAKFHVDQSIYGDF